MQEPSSVGERPRQQHQAGPERVRGGHREGKDCPEGGQRQPEHLRERHRGGTAQHRFCVLLSSHVPKRFPCPATQVELRLQLLEDQQMDIMMRLNNLSLGVAALRNKTEMNRQMAKDALAQADNATQQASSLDKVSKTVPLNLFKGCNE